MSDDTVIELARLLAEATRARRLAEAAAMDERCGARAFARHQAADEARRIADELKAAQAQIVELRARLDEAARARAELDVNFARARTEIETERDVTRRRAVVAERERDEARAEVEKLTIDCAQVAHLRGLLREVLSAWYREAAAGDGIDEDHAGVYERALAAARGDS